MDRYYKIAKDSETGKKLAELVERYNDFKETRKKFADKYGVKGWHKYQMYLARVADVVFDTVHLLTETTGRKVPNLGVIFQR